MLPTELTKERQLLLNGLVSCLGSLSMSLYDPLEFDSRLHFIEHLVEVYRSRTTPIPPVLQTFVDPEGDDEL